MTETTPAAELSRRRWLACCFWVVSATVATLMSAPLIGYFLGPLLRKRTELKVRLGPVDEFPPDRPQRVEFALRRRDGWVTEEGRRAAWVVRRGQGAVVFDPRCTHLSCAYHWHTETQQFLCPCHNGLYDIEGRVVGGPPPRPLDTYAATVEDGVIFVVPVPTRRS